MNGEIITEKSQEYNDSNSNSNAKRSPNAKDMVVSLLDDTEFKFFAEPKSKGEDLLKQVHSHLNLEEAEFFGLLFVGRDAIQYWLDPQKSITKQIKDIAKTKFKFRVMYYTPDPNSLQEYTRYLFTLQIRRDLLDGRLWCTEDTGALLASYIVQGELGNYDPVKHADGYLKGFNFVPNQTPEIEQKIVNYHISHRGKNPADSDHQMLDIARKLDMYGITLYNATDNDGRDVELAMHHGGIMVFQNKRKLQNYTWANLRKLSFKKRKVLLKLRSQSNKDIISFLMKNRNAAKNFWKICVNHHVFFKSPAAPENKTGSFKKGSKYRYSGRTKKEITEVAAKIRSHSEYENEMTQSGGGSYHMPSQSEASESIHQQKPSEDEGTYSIDSSINFTAKDNNRVEDLVEDNFIPTVLQQQNVITMKHPSENDTDDTATCTVIETCDTTENDEVFPERKVSLMDKLKMTENSYDEEDNIVELKVDLTNTEPEMEDENDFSRLNTFNGHDFSLEVASMFQKINSEYGNSQSGWQYNITAITPSGHEDDEKEEGSETEDSRQDRSEYTEVDANQVMFELNGNNEKQCSDKTEADEETEMQMKQRVQGLTYPVYSY